MSTEPSAIRTCILHGVTLVAGILIFQSSSHAQQTTESVRLVPLYCIFSVERTEHFYTVGRSEVDALAGNRRFRNLGIVGYGAAQSEDGDSLVQLRRYVDSQGYHYFASFVRKSVDRTAIEPLGIKVWKGATTRTVPVYGSCYRDGRDVYFTLSRSALRRYDQEAQRITGRVRTNLGVVFHMYPPNYTQRITRPAGFTEVDWLMLRGNKYRYSASAVEHDNRRYLFCSGNIDRPDRPEITDHILLRVGELEDGEWRYGQEEVVLAPGDDWNQPHTAWDNRRVSDASVIRGEFSFRRGDREVAETFGWAMFYSALNEPYNEGGTHQVAVAVAAAPEGPWHKAGVIVPVPSSDAWGAGVPNPISLDGKGHVLLIYSMIDAPESGRCMVRELDLSDVNNPRVIDESQMTGTGLTTTFGTPDAIPTGGAIVLDADSDTFWLLRPAHPSATLVPNYTVAVQLASIPRDKLTAADGEWTVLADYHAPNYGFLRFFCPHFVDDATGRIPQDGELKAFVSTATTEGVGSGFLWTYRFHELRIDRSEELPEDANP